MKRRYLQVADELEAGLRAGTFGPAGEAFLSVRQIAAEYGISLDSACLVMTELCARRRIRLDGKHYYITTGYVRPDTPYGQRLAAARKPVFGMLLNAIESPFFAALAKELCEASEKNGYTLLIADSGNFPGREAQRIDSFLMSGASGLFVSPSISPNTELFSTCPLPIVFLGRDLGLKNCDAVTVDNYAAGRQVAEHLWEIDCQRFAYIGIREYLADDPRLKGFEERLRFHGAELYAQDILAVDYLPDGGLDYASVSGGIQSLLSRLSKGQKLGLFCYHDLLASYALQRIKHISHRTKGRFGIPDEVAIVGFDDLPLAPVIVPALTTVQYQYASIAEEAMRCMLDYLRNPAHTPGRHKVASSLCIRGSTLRSEQTK